MLGYTTVSVYCTVAFHCKGRGGVKEMTEIQSNNLPKCFIFIHNVKIYTQKVLRGLATIMGTLGTMERDIPRVPTNYYLQLLKKYKCYIFGVRG